MRPATPLRLALPLVILFGCGGGSSSPTRPDPQPEPVASGTFRLSGAGYDGTYSYDSVSNTVFCSTNAGWADRWVRLAEQSAGDGGGGAHLDIDVCGYQGGGTFAPKDPSSTTCSGQTWDVFWHPDPSTSFANTLTSPSCTLTIIASGDRLEGMFGCDRLREDGAREVDVLDGHFVCTVR